MSPIPLWLAILITVLAPPAVKAEEEPGTPKTLAALVDSVPSVTIAKCPDHPAILAVYAERDPAWQGLLTVYRRGAGDALEWAYTFPDDYGKFRGHYVVRFRWLKLKQTPHPVLEVIESTHMGNGSLWLFEVKDRKLVSLLDITVRGRFWSPPAIFGMPLNGEARFEGPHLQIEYQSESGQEADAIRLTGTVLIESMEGKSLPARPFSQICLWDSKKGKFLAQKPTSP